MDKLETVYIVLARVPVQRGTPQINPESAHSSLANARLHAQELAAAFEFDLFIVRMPLDKGTAEFVEDIKWMS
ncbi:MAG: hypothetical protein ACRD2A_12870 [Vicinamibacterales bacterium]